ncbi:MAG: hypothetical protein M1820_009126 [Bogoriella megaspora]|nr:MAG: hypothetical protein M1820_009126 [Bogoriella megaspora]
MIWDKPKLESIWESKSSTPSIRIIFVYPVKSKEYKDRHAECIKVLKHMSEKDDAQVQGFGFKQSKKSIRKSKDLQDLSSSFLKAMLQQPRIHGQTKLVLIAFSVGRLIVQDALAGQMPRPRAESVFLAEDTAAFVFDMESSKDISNLKPDFLESNYGSVSSLEEKFIDFVKYVKKEGHDPEIFKLSKSFQAEREPIESSESVVCVKLEDLLTHLKPSGSVSSLGAFFSPLSDSVEFNYQPAESATGKSTSDEMKETQTSLRSSTFSPAVQQTGFLNSEPPRQELGEAVGRQRPISAQPISNKETSWFKNPEQSPLSSTNKLPSNQRKEEVGELEHDQSHDLMTLRKQIFFAKSLHEGGDLVQAGLYYSSIIENFCKPHSNQQPSFETRMYMYQVQRDKYAIELQQGSLEKAEQHLREIEGEVRRDPKLGPRHPLGISFRLWLAVALIMRGNARSALDCIDQIERDLDDYENSVVEMRKNDNRPRIVSKQDQKGLEQYQKEFKDIESEIKDFRLTWKSSRFLALTQNGEYELAMELGRDISGQVNQLRNKNLDRTEMSERDELSRERLLSRENEEAALVTVGRVKADLASMYFLAELFEESQEMNEDALCILKKCLGERHPKTLASASLQSALQAATGSIREAEAQARVTLDIMQMRLGEYHPVTLQHLRILARIFRFQGRFVKAEARILRLCSSYGIQSKYRPQYFQGSEEQWIHPEVIEAQCELCLAQLDLGKGAAAMDTQQCLPVSVQAFLQPNHPVFAKCQYVTACIFLGKEEWERAIERALIALDIHCKGNTKLGLQSFSFSSFHSNTETDIHNLLERFDKDKSSLPTISLLSMLAEIELVAMAWHGLGRVEASVDILKKVLSIRKDRLGSQRHETIMTRLQLGRSYAEIRETEIGIECLDKAQSDAIDLLGEFHPITLASRHEKSVAQYQATPFDFTKVQRIRQEQENILQLRASILGKDHPDTIRSWLDTAKTLYVLGDHTAARDSQRNAVYALGKPSGFFGPGHMKTLRCQLKLAQLELEGGDIDQARMLQGKAAQQIESKQPKENKEKAAPNIQFKQLELFSHNILAQIDCKGGNWKNAEEQFAHVSASCSRDQPLWLSNQLDFSLLLYQRCEYKKAEDILKELDERMGQKSFSEIGLTVKFNLALTRKAKHDRDRSISDMRTVVDLAKSNFGTNHPTTREMERVLEEWGEMPLDR